MIHVQGAGLLFLFPILIGLSMTHDAVSFHSIRFIVRFFSRWIVLFRLPIFTRQNAIRVMCLYVSLLHYLNLINRLKRKYSQYYNIRSHTIAV